MFFVENDEMNKSKLISQLNFTHFSIVGSIIFILLIVSMLHCFFQNRKSVLKENKNQIINLEKQISDDLNRIASFAKFIGNESFDDDDSTYFQEIIRQNGLIDFVLLVDKTKPEETKMLGKRYEKAEINYADKLTGGISILSVGNISRTCYILEKNRNTSVVIVTKRNWIETYNHFPHSSGNKIILYDVNTNRQETSLKSEGTNVQQFKFTSPNFNFQQGAITFSKIKADKNRMLFSYFTKIENSSIFLCLVNEPTKEMSMTTWPHIYFALFGFILFVLVVIIIGMINNHFLEPITQISTSIKLNDKFITEKAIGNEYELITRYINSLESQLNVYEKKIEKIEFDSQNLENDLKLANRLQKNLLPVNTAFLNRHSQFDISAFSEPVFKVGGDLYDCFFIDNEHLFVVVADIAGKGIAASLYMIYTHTLLRSVVKPNKPVNEIIEELNNQLIEENVSDMFVTMFAGILTLPTGEFAYCNAAHNLPCLITSTGNVSELPETHGIPVGIYPNRTYLSSVITLNEGDQVFIYTDGLTDTKDENGLKFTIDVLKYNLMGAWFFTPEEVIERIKNSVAYFRGNNKPVDDITMLDLKYKQK